MAIGVRTLSSYLKENGFETTVILMGTPEKDLRNFCWDDLYKLCKNASLIGISCMTHDLPKAVEVKKALTKKIPVPIVVGGIHASLDPGSLIKNFDLVCHGEGEDVIVELAKRLQDNRLYDDVPGLWVKHNKNIIKNTNKPLLKNLNEYPIPNYNFRSQFILEANHLIPLKLVPAHVPIDDFVVLGSRGCPHHCTYCCNRKIKHDFPWRKRPIHYSVDYLINHLKSVCNAYPSVKSFWIGDDTFFEKTLEDIKEFATRYKKEINKPFQILISPWTYKEEKIRPLIKAGMNKLIMGIQSGSEHVNAAIYDRRLSNKKMMEIAHSLNRFSSLITICYDFIGMNPFESERDMIKTINFIKELPIPFFIFNNNLAFYPGTELYNQAVKAGLDVSKRVKHSDVQIGLDILKNEKIKHKIFHLILLYMAGSANRFHIGKIPRLFISRPFIKLYHFLNNRLSSTTNGLIESLCPLFTCLQWGRTLSRILGPKIVAKSRF